MSASVIDSCRDAAQQAVTAVLNGDRDQAVRIVTGHDDPLLVALVLIDLAAYIHHRWARASGLGPAERRDAWRQLLLEIESWRAQS